MSLRGKHHTLRLRKGGLKAMVALELGTIVLAPQTRTQVSYITLFQTRAINNTREFDFVKLHKVLAS